MLKLLRLALLLSLVSSAPGVAGENLFLGTITVSGSSLTNLTTAVPFKIPGGSKLTIYCDAAVRILTDNPSVAASGANKGLPVAASVYFPTSVGRESAVLSPGQNTALVAVIGTGNCDFWQRAGTE